MVIKFLLNKEADARDIAESYRHSLMSMLANSERFNSELQKHNSVIKVSMTQLAPEDLPWTILMSKFWPY
jgi:hypothetical protein